MCIDILRRGFQLSVLCACMSAVLLSNIRDYIEIIFKDKEVTFIQVGSNAGSNCNDPIFAFVHKYNWSGVLIEPVPYLFRNLVENYKSVDNLYFENIAIADVKGFKDFYYFNEETYKDYKKRNVHALSDELGSFRKNHIGDHLLNPNLRLDVMQVECNTIENIVDKYNIEQLDFLHLDTEGYDVTILNSIDFDKVHPDAILFEHHHSDGTHKTGKNYNNCIDRLSKYGYSIARREVLDTLLIDRSKFPVRPGDMIFNEMH